MQAFTKKRERIEKMFVSTIGLIIFVLSLELACGANYVYLAHNENEVGIFIKVTYFST